MALARFAPRPFDDQLRMLAPECLRNMTIPANWSVFGEDLWELFRTNLVPLYCLPVRIQQGRSLSAQPVDALDRFTAVHACFSRIPPGDHRPDQTVLRSGFNLTEALLSTALAF